MNYFLSIIMTAYNEESSITPAFLDIKKALSLLKINYEIILVNDASIDKTQTEINKIVSSNKEVISIINKKNFGPGKSFTILVGKLLLDSKMFPTER